MLQDHLIRIQWGPAVFRAEMDQRDTQIDQWQPIMLDGSVAIAETPTGRALSVADWIQQGVLNASGNGRFSFKVYKSGDHSVRVLPGFLLNKMPGNNFNEFTIPSVPDGAYALSIKGNTMTDATGALVSATLLVQTVTAGSLPADPSGSEGHAPAFFTRPLAFIQLDGSGDFQDADITPCHRSSLDVSPVVKLVTCSGNTLQFFCGDQINDPLAPLF